MSHLQVGLAARDGEDEEPPAFIIVADASPVMMAALQAISDIECGFKLIKRSQLVGKKFRPVVDLQWLPHSLVDWQMVLDGRCMCNHFCARSALVRKAELYQLLLDARGSDLMPVTPTTHVFCYNESLTAADEAVLTELLCERSCCTDSEADAAHCDIKLESSRNQTDGKLWLLKAGNSSNGNGIHMVSRFDQLACLLKAEQPRGCWCVQEFLSDAALVHGCRYSVRLLLLIASSQAQHRPCFSAWAFRRPIVLRCLVPFVHALNKREYLSNSQGDSDVIRDCAFLFENLPALAAAGAATSFDVDECMRLMCEHARAAVSAAVATMIPVPRCFEFFAADFILDSSGRPWLLEVNADPSWALWQHEQAVLQEFVSAAIRLARAGFNCAGAGSEDCLVQLFLP